MAECKECGLFRSRNGEFTRYTPSDCHDKGGHYKTEYEQDGRFIYTTAPWQTFPSNDDLTEKEMDNE